MTSTERDTREGGAMSARHSSHHERINMLTGLKNGDSANARLMFQPDTENVSSRVDIAIVRRPAIRTLPMSYSKTRDTSRPRLRQRAACRTGLGTPSFVGFDKHRLPSGKFVSQHGSERRPARVQDGFRHLGFGKLGGVHIADNDCLVLPRNLGGLHVKMVTPRVCDFGVDGFSSLHIPRALGGGKSGFILPVVTHGRNSVAVAERSQFFQAQINADLSAPGRETVLHFACEGHIPTPARVLDKSAGFNITLNRTAVPIAVGTLQVGYCTIAQLHSTWNDCYPAQRAFRPEAGAEPWTNPVLVARLHKLPNSLCHRVAVQAEHRTASNGELHQIEGAQPLGTPPLRLPLCSYAEIPDLIASYSMAAKVPLVAFDPIFEGNYRHRLTINCLLVELNCKYHYNERN
jgi:hypothetical protein